MLCEAFVYLSLSHTHTHTHTHTHIYIYIYIYMNKPLIITASRVDGPVGWAAEYNRLPFCIGVRLLQRVSWI